MAAPVKLDPAVGIQSLVALVYRTVCRAMCKRPRGEGPRRATERFGGGADKVAALSRLLQDFVLGRKLRSYIIEQQLRVAHQTSILARPG